ncbi:TonB-dependent receptor domain-containing protein [Luteimonas aquatica]|uniref:TonB-dependent receptor domain-containing protein n=1 Tax=Luteimonas aquatica TaxID=450364 RepID=UPI001F5A7D15|nr:TonB-dependent receptor [Luteimonas aquatica]
MPDMPLRTALLSALALAPFAPSAAFAQDAPEAKKAPADLEKIVVTGSRIARAQVEGPTPVTVITAEDMRKQGFVTIHDALSSLTEATGYVESDAGWGSHTSNASPLNLRNMGPGRSLLLINGHRAADYPLPYGGRSNFQNFTNIPSAAVERIEVLASGASAIYGSDAIAGVINVVLKKGYVGDEFRIKAGGATNGGRALVDASWAGGRAGEKWSLTYAAQYLKRDPLFAGERDFLDSENDAGWLAWDEASRARGNRFNNYYDTARLSLLDGSNRRISPPPGACENPGFGGVPQRWDFRLYDNATDTLGPSLGQYCANGKFPHNWTIRDGEESASLYLYGTYDFSDRLQGWASVMAFDSEGTSSIGDFGMGYVPQVKWYDSEIGAYVEGKRFFTRQEIGDALTYSNERSYDYALGLKGTLFERFDWEASVDHAEYEVKKSYPAAVPALVNDFYLGPRLGVTDASYAGVPVGTPIHAVDVNRFFTPITRRDWESMSTHGHDRARSKVDQVQLVVSGDLFQGWAGPISFAAVGEWAEQSYALRPDPRTVPTLEQNANEPQRRLDNLFVTDFGSPYYGFDLGGGSRKRWAVGSEFRVPVWDSKTPGIGSATMSLAGRYDNYTQTLDAAKSTWMAGVEWRPLDNLLVRGSYATSFRAPDMHYVYAQGGQSYRGILDRLRCGQQGKYGNCYPQDGDSDPATSTSYRSITTRQGSPLLEYENGESWTAGVVWDATRDLSLSLDYWNIDLRDIIEEISTDDILAGELGCALGRKDDGSPYTDPATGRPPSGEFCDFIASRIERNGPNGAITAVREGPINRAGRRTSGVDFSGRYRLETDRFGNFTFGLNYTNVLKVETKQFEASPWSEGAPGAPDDGYHTKTTATLGWERGDFNATLFATKRSDYRGSNWGGCVPFDNGERGTAIDDRTCVGTDATSSNYGKTAERYFDRVKRPWLFNLSARYLFDERVSVGLYVNDLLDNAGHKDRYAGDYEFGATDYAIGREVALEFVYKLK